ncbi:MAG: amino acid transporter [Micromonosporaceae bacterium]|nr:amino acid transporter [Micromonosporaceae bacterium]
MAAAGNAVSVRRLRTWLLSGLAEQANHAPGPHGRPQAQRTHRWHNVMCLTGVDYFSTLGYQPGIAALAAGALSPIATLVLVLVTLAGALPVYRRVAVESPHGEGSIAMLERLLSWWAGKLLVLALLGFVATDFMITITLSSADASTHLLQNPYTPDALDGRQLLVTLVLLGLLGAVFLRGFTEAIGIAVVLVAVYLAVNVVVLTVSLWHVFTRPTAVEDWWRVLTTEHTSPLAAVAVAVLVFPKLALGLSGFETGVLVMPQITGGPDDLPQRPAGRIRGTHRLLTTAAVIMSIFLLTSSFSTAVLIPEQDFQPGGRANGRALAYLAHKYLGEVFGTGYDISTILILWFAGASAMAGLLNVVPRYLPRYGMAPEWARAIRPLVLVFTAIAFLVTILFDADVDAQGGAYATGVLVLILSAAFAVTLAVRRAGSRRGTWAFAIITGAVGYTTIANIIERPEGAQIGAFFIVGIVAASLLSRIHRSLELRATEVRLDPLARQLLAEATTDGQVHILPNEPDLRDEHEYREKEASLREVHHLAPETPVLFLEVTLDDTSEFSARLAAVGERRFGYRILKVRSPTVANSIAAMLLHIRDRTGKRPHVYFNWTEGNPIINGLKYLIFGVGEIAPITREVLRRVEPDVPRRPVVHVA